MPSAIVTSGSGQNSYVSLADANTYLDDSVRATAWAVIDDETKTRALITAFAMAIAVALCMASTAFTDGMALKLFDVMVEQQLGHLQVHHPDYPTGRKMYDTVPAVEQALERIRAVDGVQDAAARLNGFALIGGPE